MTDSHLWAEHSPKVNKSSAATLLQLLSTVKVLHRIVSDGEMDSVERSRSVTSSCACLALGVQVMTAATESRIIEAQSDGSTPGAGLEFSEALERHPGRAGIAQSNFPAKPRCQIVRCDWFFNLTSSKSSTLNEKFAYSTRLPVGSTWPTFAMGPSHIWLPRHMVSRNKKPPHITSLSRCCNRGINTTLITTARNCTQEPLSCCQAGVDFEPG
jgi:hypothetical protein